MTLRATSRGRDAKKGFEHVAALHPAKVEQKTVLRLRRKPKKADVIARGSYVTEEKYLLNLLPFQLWSLPRNSPRFLGKKEKLSVA